MYNTVSTFFHSQDRSSVNSSAEPNKRTKAYSYPYWNIDNNGRVGPVRNYLPLAEDLEKNISYQIRIRQGPQAIGVEVETDDGVSTLNLNSGCSGGKVIVAAGAWRTPLNFWHRPGRASPECCESLHRCYPTSQRGLDRPSSWPKYEGPSHFHVLRSESRKLDRL